MRFDVCLPFVIAIEGANRIRVVAVVVVDGSVSSQVT